MVEVWLKLLLILEMVMSKKSRKSIREGGFLRFFHRNLATLPTVQLESWKYTLNKSHGRHRLEAEIPALFNKPTSH